MPWALVGTAGTAVGTAFNLAGAVLSMMFHIGRLPSDKEMLMIELLQPGGEIRPGTVCATIMPFERKRADPDAS